VGSPVEKCREINSNLLADTTVDGGYSEDDFENLVFRYEEPNGMNRWDSPLFTVVYDDPTPPCEQIWDAIVGNDGKTKVVRPNQATVLVSDPPANFVVLHLADGLWVLKYYLHRDWSGFCVEKLALMYRMQSAESCCTAELPL
jgi:tRNA uridine 5-carbamoylmethylation protein Kti12